MAEVYIGGGIDELIKQTGNSQDTSEFYSMVNSYFSETLSQIS